MSASTSQRAIEKEYELAKLYRDRGDFTVAIQKLEPLAELYNEQKSYSMYLLCLNDLARMHAERDEQDKIHTIKEKLQDLVLQSGFVLTPYTYYTLGVCATHKKQTQVALEYYQKSLISALQTESKKDMCYAITGLVTTYVQLGRYQEALQEIGNLRVFFEVISDPDLQIWSQILHSMTLRRLQRFDEALNILWKCYENLKVEKNHYLHLRLLYTLGVTYKDQGSHELAKIYLQLVRKALDPHNFIKLTRQTDQRLLELGYNHAEFDIVFNITEGAVVERKKGRVDFNNQFILLELLNLLIKYPGQTFSKEAIVKKVWNEDYSPAIHDNKIYVTIKRLRKMIEPDIDKPKYIFRAKNGYYFNKDSRVRYS